MKQVFPVPASKIRSIIAIDEQNRFRPIVSKDECLSVLEKHEGSTLPTPPAEIDEKLTKFKQTSADTVLHYANTGEFLKVLHEDGGKIADVAVSIGGDVFSCHRVALACYSHYFRSLFFKNEKYQKVPIAIRLRGIHAESFQTFLKYVYSGSLEITPELAGDLIIMAEKLNIPVLKDRCIEFMDSMPVEQALNLIKYGIVSSSVALFDCVMSCISDKFNELPNIIEFLQLDVATVVLILSHDHLILNSEMDVFRVGLKWIAHSMADREQHVSRIMACVRFTYMSQEDLFKCIELTDLLSDNAYCRDALLKANWLVLSMSCT